MHLLEWEHLPELDQLQLQTPAVEILVSLQCDMKITEYNNINNHDF